MNKDIKKLADSMGVSEVDVMGLARSVINSLEKDKMIETFKNSSKEDMAELTLAYVVDANKKWQKFVSIYKTIPGADKLFQNTVIKLKLVA